jgi:hypothetical protein
MKTCAILFLHLPVLGVTSSLREPTYMLTFLLVVSPVAVFEVYVMDVCQRREATWLDHQQQSYKK